MPNRFIVLRANQSKFLLAAHRSDRYEMCNMQYVKAPQFNTFEHTRRDRCLIFTLKWRVIDLCAESGKQPKRFEFLQWILFTSDGYLFSKINAFSFARRTRNDEICFKKQRA
jgi:hypothetical protein